MEEQTARKDDNLTALCEPIFYKMWESRRLITLWVSTASPVLRVEGSAVEC
jgi:hypothetical protein